ncbi:MAG: hypothetical protein KGI68_12180 [Alphaproteobacteria bacterium]|nr:hypothetical protein [Alphaproteobacteria bacterium]MDE1987627.1 hypothetical protein [Alphaproteobacteria bacterium]MDE2164585.1 hypothetical protein [Alphaproteobacteria bacterium]MDE2266225.1 hypothetical protein [Alphaproteobacteria bacterium]MDE2499456.1 hypothetical protein [Alphaproteobacteria bacterium]
MSIIGGLVDTHHEMELAPSARLIHSSWLARHMGAILLTAAVVLVYFLL